MHDRTAGSSTRFILTGFAESSSRGRQLRCCPDADGNAPLRLAPRDRGAPWALRLREALARRQFVLHYQPIVWLDGSGVSHHEALLRLADGDRGQLIAPGEFLPYAERSGLIKEIDEMVLSEAVGLLGGLLADRLAPVAVNLSALSVTDAHTLTHMKRLLQLHDVDPSRLIVELTETAAISDMVQAQRFC